MYLIQNKSELSLKEKEENKKEVRVTNENIKRR